MRKWIKQLNDKAVKCSEMNVKEAISFIENPGTLFWRILDLFLLRLAQVASTPYGTHLELTSGRLSKPITSFFSSSDERDCCPGLGGDPWRGGLLPPLPGFEEGMDPSRCASISSFSIRCGSEDVCSATLSGGCCRKRTSTHESEKEDVVDLEGALVTRQKEIKSRGLIYLYYIVLPRHSCSRVCFSRSNPTCFKHAISQIQDIRIHF